MYSGGSSTTSSFDLPLPPELSAYALEQPAQLGVGVAGKQGVLDVGFQRDSSGSTFIDRQYAQLPLHITRPLRLDAQLPGMAFLYIQMPTGGLLQGDRLKVNIDVKEGAQAHVTTQSQSRVYRMDRNYAAQDVEITVAEGALLEYYPDALSLHQDARYVQRTRLTVDDNATAILGEIVLPGRMASGEAFLYDLFYSALEATGQQGQMRFKEAILLEPKRRDLTGPGVLGQWKVFGNLYAISRAKNPDQLSDEVHGVLQSHSGVLSGASILPAGDGIVVRVLGPGHRQVKAALDAAWDLVRLSIVGAPAPRIRK